LINIGKGEEAKEKVQSALGGLVSIGGMKDKAEKNVCFLC
jgi:hypothetical protein